MSKTTIFHNPKCSKSRQTLQLLEEKELDIEIVEYLKTPPTQKKIAETIKLLDIQALDLIRTKETLFKELGLSKKDVKTDKEWIKIMAENPKLIERPIIFANGKAVIGRPPENIEDLY